MTASVGAITENIALLALCGTTFEHMTENEPPSPKILEEHG